MNFNQNLLPSFLMVYFYQLENQLNTTKNQLETIKFQSEEANTDEYLKKYFQEFLLKNNDISNVNIQKLAVKIDKEEYVISIEKLKSYRLVDVLLPEQLSPPQKQQITKSKKSVYTSPDLYLKITNGKQFFFESVELKSTKSNNISGSSIQQVSPFEWVIFVKRDKSKVLVTTGFYINSITEKLPFPDRSPRPQISFKTLSDWNKKYRKVENKILTIENTTEINDDKIRLLTDWQDFLATEWLAIIKTEEAQNHEKWFNNTLRKFALKFLEYSDTLHDSDKEKLISSLKKNIK